MNWSCTRTLFSIFLSSARLIGTSNSFRLVSPVLESGFCITCGKPERGLPELSRTFTDRVPVSLSFPRLIFTEIDTADVRRGLWQFLLLNPLKSKGVALAAPRVQMMEPRHFSLPVWHPETARKSNNELRMRTAGAPKKAPRLQIPATLAVRRRNCSTGQLKTQPVSRAACGNLAHVEVADD